MARLAWISMGLATMALAFGCSSEGGVEEIDNGFESDDPSGRSAAERAASDSAGSSSSGGSADASSSASTGAEDPSAERTVQEADIIKVDGTRLYTLSRYGGLAVIDITSPDHMRVIGRKRIDGMPFEMYVEGTKAFVMLNDFGHWVPGGDGYYGSWVQSSEILAFDLGDPTNIAETAHFDVPGSIADSRLVGDVAYVVTYENGYCWGCGKSQATIVTSFKVAGAITKSDQLSFAPASSNYASWQRSVSATNQRLYIAGPDWSWSGQGQYNSVIQVVDIADPNGRLVKGANVTIAGQITNRWQMDEYEGVLRVVSQPGQWFGGTVNPKLQTFTVASSSQITPLGQTDIVLPKPESLRSVRFDGTRGYASTSERTDPLFTLDLSTPATPRQTGNVELPGYIYYMEPRGNRLIGFGYDDTNASKAQLSVTLFDVTDLKAPRVMKQTSFGSGWGYLAEDQDRIQKSVQVLDDQGLILVPFASYGRWSADECESGQSGIQLIDYTGDDLAVRGIAPQYGMPRRAFVANGRLVGMSDRNVTTFDIGSRDNPTKTGELDLSNPAYRLLELPDHVASITNDWWTGAAMLSLTPKANADVAQTTGKVSLAALAGNDRQYCGASSSWTAWYDARMFAVSPTSLVVTVPVYAYSYDSTKNSSKSSGKLITAAIDITDPKNPKLTGRADLGFRDRESYYGYGWLDGYSFYSYYGGYNGSLVGSGKSLVQYGAKLAYIELGYGKTTDRRVHVVDYANPTAPVVASPIDLPSSIGASPLHLFHGTLLTSRWVQSNAHADRVRFFMDRIDLTGPTPTLLASVNTPGSLVLVDEPSNRIVTTDYRATRVRTASYEECYAKSGWRGWFDSASSICTNVDRSFKLADVDGTRVSLRQTLELPAQNIGGVAIAEDRIYVTRYKRYDYSGSYTNGAYVYTAPKVLEEGGLWAIGGIRGGRLSIVSQLAGDMNWPLASSGTKVALYTDSGLSIYDTVTPTPTLVSDTKLRGWGYSSDVIMSKDTAIAALGEWGLQTISY